MHRAIAMVALLLIGWQIGVLSGTDGEHPRNALMGMGVGLVLGFALAPLLVTGPLQRLRTRTSRMPSSDLVAATAGALAGLLCGALLAFPLSLLPWNLGHLAPTVVALALAYVGAVLMLDHGKSLFPIRAQSATDIDESTTASARLLLDTSAIIDGRVVDIARAGFLSGTLVVPRFVLHELQGVADSPDAHRRARGRRGLDTLHRLQDESRVQVEVLDKDVPRIPEVDGKLVQLAMELGARILTNDFNLNRIAQLQGVGVLNINELANALRPVVLPGEEMSVMVIQEGKEPNQGLAYLDDGTMIVVENGRRFMRQDLKVVVTRVLQTSAGRMIFAHARPEADLT